MKVGDTYRSVAVRLEEWRRHFPDLHQEYEALALVDQEIYFRDYAVHQHLEQEQGKYRLQSRDIAADIYYSNEFFSDLQPIDIDVAIADIKDQYQQHSLKYDFYRVADKHQQNLYYQRGREWTLRPNQAQVVENFRKALARGRKNLLMYAVMRFGKSFTALSCALTMGAKLVVIVSAKADVKDEWKKTVETAGNFRDFVFLESRDLLERDNPIRNILYADKTAVVFLTLQDLQGSQIKNKHRELLQQRIDLLIVDETHFGARARSYGAVLQDRIHHGYDYSDRKLGAHLEDDLVYLEDAQQELKHLDADIRLHLSGTPYRILMGSEFTQEDIIAFVQFTDIVAEQEKWVSCSINNYMKIYKNI